jgi:hypothetical protein
VHYLAEWHGRPAREATHNMHFRSNQIGKFAHAHGVTVPGTDTMWWGDRRRLLALALILDDARHGQPIASHPDVTHVLEEGRGWIQDIGYTTDAWALTGRSVARIIATHCEGGVSGFVELCALPEWTRPCIATCPACPAYV